MFNQIKNSLTYHINKHEWEQDEFITFVQSISAKSEDTCASFVGSGMEGLLT